MFAHRLPFAALPHALFEDTTLTRLDHAMMRGLLAVARRRTTLEATNERLAELAHCSVRAVQQSLNRLAAAGWIRIVRGVAGRLQRSILLLFRGEEGSMHVRTPVRPSPAPTGAPPCAPQRPPLMYPPVIQEKDDDDETPSTPRPVEYCPPIEETIPAPRPLSSSSPSLDPIGKGPDVDSLHAQAVALWGDSPECRARIESLCRIFPGSWISRAIDLCVARLDREDVGFGLMLAILNNWKREGGPPPPKATRRVGPTARINHSPLAPLEPAAAPSDEDLAELRAHAANERHPLHRFARKALGLAS